MSVTPNVVALLTPAILLLVAGHTAAAEAAAEIDDVGSIVLTQTGMWRARTGEAQQPVRSLKSYAVEKVRQMPHEGKPWTQGLEFSEQGHLVETSGDWPPGSGSFVRLLDPRTGAETMRTSQGLTKAAAGSTRHVFIEGITQMPSGRWFASTYEDRLALEYDQDFNFLQAHHFPWTGWGFTHSADGTVFMATNSTEHVMFLRPGQFDVIHSKVATCLGKRVTGLNELEMVDDFLGGGPALLGNIINTRVVLALDPTTLECTGTFHLDGLEPKEARESYGFHVANGIAYDRKSGTFYVTGKNWASIFEVRLSEEQAGRGSGKAVQMLERHLQGARPAPASGAATLNQVQRHQL